MFTSILSTIQGTLSIQAALISMFAAILIGFIIAGAYMMQGQYSKQFVVTIIILPLLVQSVIMLVNGNLGTSVAVMGAFSLVRFRSLPGSSREISVIFFAMVAGLATGMGFITYAIAITIMVGIMMVVLSKLKIGENSSSLRVLRITIPENLDYTDVFDDVLDEYTKSHCLDRVKTTNMGSMFELSYNIRMKNDNMQKQFIDALRCRNGNLTIVCQRPVSREEL